MDFHATDKQLLEYDPFAGDKDGGGVTYKPPDSPKVVKTRKGHTCNYNSMHSMPPGTRAVYWRAVVDGSWGSFYICAECIERELRELGELADAEGVTPVDGVCCSCGYSEAEETPCAKREDESHCVHWWDGPEDEEG